MRRVLLFALGMALVCVGVLLAGVQIDVVERQYATSVVPDEHVDADDEVVESRQLGDSGRETVERLVTGEVYRTTEYQFAIGGTHLGTLSRDRYGIHVGEPRTAERLETLRYVRHERRYYRVTDRADDRGASGIGTALGFGTILLGGVVVALGTREGEVT